MSTRIYLSTTIPYVNARPHIGFALELVQADVLARHHRQLGDQVRFQMTRTAKRRNMWWFRGEAKVDGVLVCEAEVSAMLVDK